MQSPLATYEAALAALEKADERAGLEHKHQAVLALTRAGSLDFALSEYNRYELGEIRHHEDIMGLGGRLYKDLYLAHSGEAAKEFARLSAEKYEDAYQDTGGYYSGINAATMSILGGIPKEIVEMRAGRILEGLPSIADQPDEEIYFMEATRAEAHILLDDIAMAQAALRRAFDYDPLNYTAHASTLKQFRMIARSQDEEWAWLSEFDPPRAMYFAGHIFGQKGDVDDVPVLTGAEEQTLADDISNFIQENDIGFAYGALAAGADILVAEAILEEGGELHVILPVPKKIFIESSILPYGKSWLRRFNKCLKLAKSVNIYKRKTKAGSSDTILRQRASLIAMGDAIRKAEELAVEAVQLLIWDEVKGDFGTARDASTWANTQRPQYVLPYSAKRHAKPHKAAGSEFKFETVLNSSAGDDARVFEHLDEGVRAALDARQLQPNLRQGLVFELTGNTALKGDDIVDHNRALPGGIYVSELAANYLTVHYGHDYRLDYVGLGLNNLRVFALRERG